MTTNLTPVFVLPHWSSNLLNIVLHAIYNLSSQLSQPTLDILLASIEALKVFGLQVSEYIKPTTPLFLHILALMPLQPMDVFICAAENKLEELAVATSSYLVSYDLAAISDPMAERMGPIYLKRLVLLHSDRVKVLKRLLLEPPKQHNPVPTCCFQQQQALTRAWNLACATFAWEVTPGICCESL